MGLDFSRPAGGAIQAQNPARDEQEDYQQYDIVADRAQMNATLTNSPEVDRAGPASWRSTIWSPSCPSAPAPRRRSPSVPTWF